MARKEKKPKVIWDNCWHIGQVQKSPKLRLNIELVVKDGIKYVNIRELYSTKAEPDVYKPSIKGLVIPIEYPLEDSTKLPVITEFMRLVADAVNKSIDMPIYDEANVVYAVPKEAK